MTRYFAILAALWPFIGGPSLADDGQGHLIPRGSFKDAPPPARTIIRDIYQHRDAVTASNACSWNEDTEPLDCEYAVKPQRAPGGRKQPGAR
jgi:hypothetical protein